VKTDFAQTADRRKHMTPESLPSAFIHFFEDLTHYENASEDRQNLLIKPATLTKAYLSGKPYPI
jgi:hypothetical protein